MTTTISDELQSIAAQRAILGAICSDLTALNDLGIEMQVGVARRALIAAMARLDDQHDRVRDETTDDAPLCYARCSRPCAGYPRC